MTSVPTAIEDEAIGWIIRLRDPVFDEWDAFTAWLEADPAHARAYDDMALADADIGSALEAMPAPVSRAANDDEPEARGIVRRRALGWGIAASLLAILGYSSFDLGPSTYEVRTAANARQTVKLADGSRIDLNGSTRLILDRDNPRFARLDRGEALFTVIHDNSYPFVVETGGTKLVDAGTAFNVIRDGGRTEVAVSEGLVIYNPESDRIALPAGRMLRSTDSGRVTVANLEAGSVASWRTGRLVYQHVPISIVAADLSRNLGVEVAADPSVGGRNFSGVIQLEGGPQAVVERAGQVAGVEVSRNAKGWLLAAEGDAAR